MDRASIRLLCKYAEVQQQMEVAQAYQVLLNASAQNQGGLANFEAMHDLVRRLNQSDLTSQLLCISIQIVYMAADRQQQ